MNNHCTKVIVDENEIDKIFDLPMDILDEIVKDMSFQELVKTCVLSKKWVHFWTMHPILVLDWEFFEEKSGTIGLIENGFSKMIDNILLHHVGSLVKFFLDLSTIDCNDRDLDHWLLCETSKCVKELTLKNHKRKRYTLAFCVFDCPTLTYLDVTNFIVKPPSPKALFPNLLELTLKFIKFCPDKANYVLNTPLLYSLTFIACNGVHFLTISAPRIQFLTVHDSHDIYAIFFDNLSNARELFMVLDVVNTLSEENIDEVTHYLEDPNCVDKRFEKLEFVELREFEGTQFELLFLKLILAYSPSLSRMIVEPSDELDVAEVLNLYEELRMSLKALLRAKVIIAPHGQDV
uniref:Ubiquitin-protein ligase n=1 Tax=Solanum tuberosum TaxID=4113 RepID=M1DWY5_SOLTU